MIPGIILIGLAVPRTALADSVLVVNSTEDSSDGSCDASHCTLREALEAANRHVGPDRIRFDIPGSPPYVLVPERSLPRMTDDQIVIEGDSEPDYDGRSVIVLNGNGTAYGLYLESDGNAVFGLSLINFRGGTSPFNAMGCDDRKCTFVLVKIHKIKDGYSFSPFHAVKPYQLRLVNHIPAATPDPKPVANKPIFGANEMSSQNITENAAAKTKNIIETPIIRLFAFICILSYMIVSGVWHNATISSRRSTVGITRRAEPGKT